jgi:hypothetical protein
MDFLLKYQNEEEYASRSASKWQRRSRRIRPKSSECILIPSFAHLDAPLRILSDHPKPANEGHLKTGQR